MMNTKKILIVDDQVGIRMLLEEVLRSEGVKVTSAETGKQALEMIQKEKPDLMLLDYKLPMMSGAELLEELDKKSLAIPAIMMSGLSPDEVKRNIHSDSVKAVLAKPFDIDEVRELIDKILV